MITLANIFQNKMVLQRHKRIKLWGHTSLSQQIRIYINDIHVHQQYCPKGAFHVYIPAQEAARNVSMRIEGDTGGSVTLNQVHIGEVWIAGGQSNMEFPLRYDKEGKATIQQANDPDFRYFEVGPYGSQVEREANLKKNTHWDKWFPFHKKHAKHFSALASYFAKELRDAYHVPVGIIGCNWGGTTAATWTSEEELAAKDALHVYLDDYEQAISGLDMDKYISQKHQAWLAEQKPFTKSVMHYLNKGMHPVFQRLVVRLSSNLPAGQMGPLDMNRPGGLFNEMVMTIAGFTCQGVIWYQGESDENRAAIYDQLFTATIQSWRKAWGDMLPFLYVQLAPFEKWLTASGDNYPLLRDRQEKVSQTLPYTWMASIMDLGDRYDIHPKEKKPVGERLALLARHHIYGEAILAQSPACSHISKERDRLILHFTHAEGGLEVKGKKIQALSLQIDQKKVQPKKIYVKNDVIIIQAKAIKKAEAITVSFAYQAFCQVNVFNKAGLPIRPFQIDFPSLTNKNVLS